MKPRNPTYWIPPHSTPNAQEAQGANAQEAQALEEQHPHFRASDGYFVLGMFEEAHAELDLADAIPELRLEAATRKMELYLLAEDWEEAALWGKALCALDEEDPAHFINYAIALDELGKRHESIAALLIAPVAIMKNPEYHYALAVYEAEEGRPWEALHHLERAIAISPGLRETALKDPRFAPLVHQLPAAASLIPANDPPAHRADPFQDFNSDFECGFGIDPFAAGYDTTDEFDLGCHLDTESGFDPDFASDQELDTDVPF